MSPYHILSNDAALAASRGDLPALQKYLTINKHLVNSPTVFQSKLLHIACKSGHLDVVEYLLSIGADIQALDYGGMRRTPLHWACVNNHLRVIEVLINAGADPKATGPGWSDLVKQRACGKKVDTESLPDVAASTLCGDQICWLAVMRPRWSIENHHMFPTKFREAVQCLLKGSQIVDQSIGQCPLNLNVDACQEIAARMAYPISSWLA